jgi:hypothetical protein
LAPSCPTLSIAGRAKDEEGGSSSRGGGSTGGRGGAAGGPANSVLVESRGRVRISCTRAWYSSRVPPVSIALGASLGVVTTASAMQLASCTGANEGGATNERGRRGGGGGNAIADVAGNGG